MRRAQPDTDEGRRFGGVWVPPPPSTPPLEGLTGDESNGLRGDEPSGAGEEEPSGAGEEEPSGAGEEEPSGAGEEEPSGAGEEEPSGSPPGKLDCIDLQAQGHISVTRRKWQYVRARVRCDARI